MLRSCAAGIRTVPRPMRCSTARRRAVVAAMSTGRPMPGSSGTTSYAPIGPAATDPPATDLAAGDADCAQPVRGAADAASATSAIAVSMRMGVIYTDLTLLKFPSETIALMTINSALTHAEAERLAARIAELEHERKHLLAVIEILKEASSSLHFIDILQSIARKLGESFGLDRCSIFLGEKGGKQVRLVASYEDPTIRNYVVDLERYPELKKAMQSGETVFIPDAANDPSLRHVKGELINRRVKSITVVPITWRSVAIGAIFLRTYRDGPTFSDADVRFVQVVASLTAQSLRNAHRYERLAQRQHETGGLLRH